MLSNHRLFRPPAEGDSLIIRVADGCPYNACTFCGMYKDIPYRIHDAQALGREFARVQRSWPAATRVFLADGDVMALPVERLRDMLTSLNELFPRLGRVNVYANGYSILQKTDEQLRELRSLKLHTLYMGLESGDDQTLRAACKRETAAEMVEAALLAQSCGLRMSVIILTGLGGRERTEEHAEATASALNEMQPRLLSALRLIPVPNTSLYAEALSGGFAVLTEEESVRELRAIVAGLELSRSVFRANHASNVISLEGRFPKDKERLLSELDDLLASGTLDDKSPGRTPWVL